MAIADRGRERKERKESRGGGRGRKERSRVDYVSVARRQLRTFNFRRRQSRHFNHRSTAGAALNVFSSDARSSLMPDKTFPALLETESSTRKRRARRRRRRLLIAVATLLFCASLAGERRRARAPVLESTLTDLANYRERGSSAYLP